MRLPLAVSLLLAAPALAPAQTPLEDIGFAPTTALPDADLVVVRERAYGADGVDLTPFGIGTGNDRYVQSIYFRFFVGPGNTTVDNVNGVVVFPDGTEILGFVTGENALGGSTDDGQATATDAIFGVAADPDDYSEAARGFESAAEEFICKVQDNAFVFLLAVTSGVDDFRVIVDYGDSFEPTLAFSLDTFGGVTIGTGTPHLGIRVGDDSNPIVFGSGDYGEAGRLSTIPITTTTPPSPGNALTLFPRDLFYIVRDTGGNTAIDGFQVPRRFPVPNRANFAIPGTPVGLTDGPDGFLYALGAGSGFSATDPVSRNTLEYTLANLPGSNTALCDTEGSRELFFVRDTSGDSMVDRFDVDTLSFTGQFAVPGVTTPVAIEEAGGLLYVLGQGGGFAELDPASGAVVSSVIPMPTGAYRGMTRSASGGELYLVRDNAGPTAIDEYDLATDTTAFGWSTFSNPGTPVDVTLGPLGLVFVAGVGSSGPAGLIALDPADGSEAFYTDCLDFPGLNRGLAYVDSTLGMSECSPATANSSGASAWISAQGSNLAGGNPLELMAWDLPANQFGYFLASETFLVIPMPGGSQGNLCVAGTVGRFVSQVQSSGALGRLRIDVDTNALPVFPPVAVAPGDTWYFQAWFRDTNPTPTSNFTDAISIRFF
ncbi:MAG: hypothetical protein GY711_27130 [bacterium]|nr:hypothetical protein [bacterium]